MSEFFQRYAPPVLVVVVAILLSILVNSIVTPIVETKIRRIVYSFLGERATQLHIGDAVPSDDQRIIQYWPCYDISGSFAGIVAHVRTPAYQSHTETLVGVSVEGDSWGVSILSTYEHEQVRRLLDRAENAEGSVSVQSVDSDAISGATISMRALQSAFAATRNEVAVFAAESAGAVE